jgi:hypothetical protein
MKFFDDEELGIMKNTTMTVMLERVWQCGCGCFSNSFSCRIHANDVFLFFKNYF